MGFEVEGLEFGVWDLELKVWGLKCGASGRVNVLEVGLGVQDLGRV